MYNIVLMIDYMHTIQNVTTLEREKDHSVIKIRTCGYIHWYQIVYHHHRARAAMLIENARAAKLTARNKRTRKK